MSIPPPIPPTISLVPVFTMPGKVMSNITPFTVRDGITYQSYLEALEHYITTVIVPYIDANFHELEDSWLAQMQAIIDYVNSVAAGMGDSVEEAQQAATDAQASAAQAEVYAGQAGQATDAQMLAVWNNVTSQFRIALNNAYAAKGDLTALTSRVVTVETATTVTLPGQINTKASIASVAQVASDLASFETETADALALKADKTDLNNSVAESENDIRIDVTEWSGPVGTRLNIPTHVSPGGGQTTHPSALFFPNKWNGYVYWMAHTPYPAGNDDDEDPNLAVSNDGITWIAAPGVTQPLDNADGQPEYNSDVNLAMGPNGEMFLFWRFYDSATPATAETIFMRKSADGVVWTPKQIVWQSSDTTFRYLSPSFEWDGSRWSMWAMSMLPTPNTVIRRQWPVGTELPTPGAIGPEVGCSIGTMQSGKEAWHLEVRKVASQRFMILCDSTTGASGTNGDLLLLQSFDGVSWVNSGLPIIPRVFAGEHDQLYKATFFPQIRNGVFGFAVIYAAWLAAGAVWNVYSTWISSERDRKDAGGGTAPALSAISGTTPGGATVPITFARPFMKVPQDIGITVNSGRINYAILSKDRSGFSVRFENYTAGGVSDMLYNWTAEL